MRLMFILAIFLLLCATARAANSTAEIFGNVTINTSLSMIDLSDSGVGSEVTLWADYQVTDDSTDVTNATCSASGGLSSTLSYVSANSRYEGSATVQGTPENNVNFTITCNRTNYETRNASDVFNAISVGGTPSGNGGGGGGGSAQPDCGNGFCELGEDDNLSADYCPEDCVSALIPNLSLSTEPNKLSDFFGLNKTVRQSFRVQNFNEFEIYVTARIACIEDDPSCEWVMLSSNGQNGSELSFSLAEGSPKVATEKEVLVTVKIPPDASERIYQTNIVVESAGLKRVVPFQVVTLASLGLPGLVAKLIMTFVNFRLVTFAVDAPIFGRAFTLGHLAGVILVIIVGAGIVRRVKKRERR